MATLTTTPGYTFTSGEQVEANDLNLLGAPAVAISNIVNADIGSGAAIALNKLATGALPSAITVAPANLAAGVAGTGPAFRAFAGATTILANNVVPYIKVALSSETYDTNNNFAGSVFTPAVAGYYFITGAINVAAGAEGLLALLYKNNSVVSFGPQSNALTYRASVSDIIYMNGTTDTIELAAYQFSGTTKTIASGSDTTFLAGCLVRN